ncbi:MAG: AAA family ATPase [Thermomicrobiales bacterium]
MTDLALAVADLKQTGDLVKSLFVERDEVIDLALLAIAAEANMFLIGLPGVAKSAVINSLFDRIEGARIGHFTLTKGSVPDTLTGPVDVEGFRERPSKWRVSTAGMLPDVHFAYISEVFKGNDLTRNAVLQVLNERHFFNGGEKQPCPLLMCAADSNEYPDFRETAAFYDRFLIRYQVQPIGDPANLMAMVRQRVLRGRDYGAPEPVVSLTQIETIHQARRAVVIPDEVAETAVTMIREINSANHDAPLGDRRFGDTFDLVAARAALDGRAQATMDDLIVFNHTA